MAIFRAIALLILLLLLVSPLPEAPAHAASLQPEAPHSAFAVRYRFYGGQCPRLCVEWYDGCNYCSCGHGKINVCTQNYCIWRGRPRCARYGF